MNGPDPARRPAAADARPAPVATVAASGLTADWCTTCKAYTRVTGEVVLITRDGVSTVGVFEWCEICDDAPDARQERCCG